MNVGSTMKSVLHCMNRMQCVALILIVAGLLTGCSGEPEEEKNSGSQGSPEVSIMPLEPEFTPILPREAFDLREEEKSVLVVDVRTLAEREKVRIPGSVAAPLGELMQGQFELPRDKPLLLVCAVGGRSYAAGLYLMSKQYLRVYNLKGGIIAWEKADLPLEYGQQ